MSTASSGVTTARQKRADAIHAMFAEPFDDLGIDELSWGQELVLLGEAFPIRAASLVRDRANQAERARLQIFTQLPRTALSILLTEKAQQGPSDCLA